MPNDIFEQLLDPSSPGEIGPDYLGRLSTIEYHTALCLLLELDRQFTPFYWTNIADDELPFVGLIEHTNFIEPERYGGRRFLYVANYLEPGHDDARRSTPRSCSTCTSRACGRSTRSSRASGSRSAGCSASRPRSRS